MQSLDALVLALAQSAQLSLARLTMLAEPAYTGMHPFLGDGTPAASGVMIVEYSAASALAELRALATPAGIQVVTLSRGVEEDASFATLAAQQALGAVSRFRAVLAAELVAALRCLRMQGSRPPVLADVLAWLDERDGGVPDMHDRDLTHDLVMSEESVVGLADLYRLYRGRIADWRVRPPPTDWDGTFTARTSPQTFVYLQGTGIGDLNGDGRPDFGGACPALISEPAAGSKQPHNHQQQDGADGRIDDLRDEAGPEMDAKLWK